MATEQRLIDANALDALEDLDYDYAPVRDGCAWYRAADVWACIENQPTVDAVPVVHGRWLRGDEMPDYPRVLYISDKHYCSECRNEAHEEYDGSDYSEILSDYCPQCGAKMDGGTDNGC